MLNILEILAQTPNESHSVAWDYCLQENICLANSASLWIRPLSSSGSNNIPCIWLRSKIYIHNPYDDYITKFLGYQSRYTQAFSGDSKYHCSNQMHVGYYIFGTHK